jgi:hypothetical protein
MLLLFAKRNTQPRGQLRCSVAPPSRDLKDGALNIRLKTCPTHEFPEKGLSPCFRLKCLGPVSEEKEMASSIAPRASPMQCWLDPSKLPSLAMVCKFWKLEKARGFWSRRMSQTPFDDRIIFAVKTFLLGVPLASSYSKHGHTRKTHT